MPVKAKIRYDFKAETGTRRFFWKRNDLLEVAKKVRNQKVSLLRNLPLQGINVELLDVDHEVYLIPGDGQKQTTAYAPVEMVVEADSLEDLMPLTLREEFRKIKILEPNQLLVSNNEVERFIFRVNEEYRSEIEEL